MGLVSSVFQGSGSTVHLDDGVVTAQQVAIDGARLANALAATGLETGARIAVWATSGLPYLRCVAAAAAGRFVLVSVNTRFGADEAWSIITRSGASVLVTDQELDRSGEGIRTLTPADIDELVAHDATDAEPDADDPFIVFTTSGTTSQPKLVLHTQRSIAVHAADIPARFGYDRASRVMVALPLCGVFGLSGLMGAIAAGSEIWLPSRFDAEETAKVVDEVGITAMNGSDDMFHRMLATGADLSTIETAGYGRFNTSLDGIVARADEAGLTLTGIYGMSEVQALYALRDPSEPAELRARAGGALTSSEAAARVADTETGEILPVGHDGELQLLGPSLFAGYLAEGGAGIDRELTDDAFVTDHSGRRWFRTGDLARMESDGTFTYLTRMGDVLRLGGFLVSPSEIEEAVMEVDGVSAAQVVAVPRATGVRPVAIVIGDHPVDEAAVIDHCTRRLARFKVPIRVVEVDEFPTTPSANGTKIQRNKLRELAVRALGESTDGLTGRDG